MKHALFFLMLTLLVYVYAGVTVYGDVTVNQTTYTVNAVWNLSTGYSYSGEPVPSESYTGNITISSIASADAVEKESNLSGIGVGWGGLVIFYDNESNTTQEYLLGPGLSDGYITVTQVEYVTTTTTVTKTITLPNGETTVVTEIKTVTIPSDSGPRIRPEVLGLGALAAFLLLLAIRGLR